MLNRMNLTLSALALSNRLNLGTRSLAANASVNKGGKTQDIRRSHHDGMREGMVWSGKYPIPQIGSLLPPIPSSFSTAPQCPSQRVAVRCSSRVADVQVSVEPRPDNLADRPERSVSGCFPEFTTTTTIQRSRQKHMLCLDLRLRSRLSRLGSLKRHALATAPQLAAARHATTGK
jgi:hypothetical protein